MLLAGVTADAAAGGGATCCEGGASTDETENKVTPSPNTAAAAATDRVSRRRGTLSLSVTCFLAGDGTRVVGVSFCLVCFGGAKCS
jgi:hypothetical protein